MKTTIFSSRDFNQRINDAKRAAAEGPVLITNRGRPEHVLLTVEEYQRIQAKPNSMAELLAIQPPGRPVPSLTLRKARLKLKVPSLD